MKNLRFLPVVVIFAGCMSGHYGTERGTADAAFARQLVAAHQQSVITVLGTLKVTTTVKGLGMKQENEAPVEVAATIVDPAGLVIAGSLALDPVSTLFHGPLHITQGEQTLEIEMTGRLEKLRLLLADKTEVPARVVTRDDDLGLTVLAAEPPAGTKLPAFSALPLTAAVTPQLYAPCLILGRAGTSFQRTPVLSRGLPIAELTKPRPCYEILTAAMPLGLPIFDTDGKLAGIGAVDFRPPNFEQLDQIEKIKSRPLPIILPVADIRELVARTKKTAPPPAVAAGPASQRSLGTIPAAQAAALVTAKQEAIVILRGSLKYNDGRNSKPREQNVECVATLVDGTGFAICGNSGKTADLKYEEQRLRYVLSDGTEVPVRIVLQDDDLMLSVLAPTPKAGEKNPPLHSVPLQPRVTAQLFDDVLAIGRLNRGQRYTTTADTGKIIACITHPRTFYLADSRPGGENLLGTPVFCADGRLLGIFAQQAPQARRSSRSTPFEFTEQPEHLRIVPAAALAELLEQAHKAATQPKK